MEYNAERVRRNVRSVNQSNELLIEAHEALSTAIEEWETPDSPEGFVFAMKHLMNVRNRIAAFLQLKNKPYHGNTPSQRSTAGDHP